MVTVIANKDEFNPLGHNGGVHIGSNDTECGFIKDYQEVDFHRSCSCKPFPEDFFALANQNTEQSSIEGTYFVQIDRIESCNQLNTNEQTNDNCSLLLMLTDGNLTVRGITIQSICDLSLNTRPGCKLLLTGVIPIKNGLLQLSSSNTRFQYGSSTYPRPKSAFRGRGGGSYRVSYEGRRGGGNSNNRYDNHTNEPNLLKGPPPKTTLMDFMTSLKITGDSKMTHLDNHENEKSKDRHRRQTDFNKYSHDNSLITDETNNICQETNNENEQIPFEQVEINEQIDCEDDPMHSNYRERRNPLPPRLQRAQEERTRRNTVRYYDETVNYLGTNELNVNYRNGTTMNQTLPTSSSSYSRYGDQTCYLSTNHNPYANLLTTINPSTQHHLAYFPTNTGPLIYNLTGMTSSSFGNPSTYTLDPLAFCYGTPYPTVNYHPSTINNGYNTEMKVNMNPSNIATNSSMDDNENRSINESQQDENQSQISSSSSINEGNVNLQQINCEQNQTNKYRDSNSITQRIRWKIGDLCLARWSDDREFYPATIVEIHAPFCTVLFRDYNNYDQVHFSDLKIFSRNQSYYSYSTSDMNCSAANAYLPPRLSYYPSSVDGCLIMPEAPPFPFNSAGTLCMCVPSMTSVPRSNRYSNNCQTIRRQDNGIANETTIHSLSTMSKDSNDTSISNSSTVSNDEQQQNAIEQIEPCSIADAPLTLVTHVDQIEENCQMNEDRIINSKSSE